MPLFFGYLGVLNCAMLAPIVVVLLIVDPRVFSGLTATVFGFVTVKGLCDNVLSDYLWARAVILTTPTVATVGLSLTIPLAFASDMVFKGKVVDALSGVGAGLVVAGFVFVNVGSREFEEKWCWARGPSSHRASPLR